MNFFSLNRHTKTALFVAPFLLVGGYIASDQYMEHKANQPKFFQLSTSGTCDLLNSGCLQVSGEMKLKITDENGLTKVNTSFPVDRVALSLVYANGDETIYDLKESNGPQYWERATDIRQIFDHGAVEEKLRILVKMKGNTYLNEFIPESP